MQVQLEQTQILKLENQLVRLRDSSGRPLGEARIPASERIDVEFDLRTCPYSGSRLHHSKPMNVSPLSSIFRNWQEILMTISVLRKRITGPQSRLRSIGVLNLIRLTESAAQYPLFRLAQNPEYRPTEAEAGLYKTILGPRGLAWFFLNLVATDSNWTLNRRVRGIQLARWVEETGSLIGTKEVCAGPNSYIKEFTNALCKGVSHSKSSSDKIENLIDETDPLIAFSNKMLWINFIRRVLATRAICYANKRDELSQETFRYAGVTRDMYDDALVVKLERLNIKYCSKKFNAIWHPPGLDADSEISKLRGTLSQRRMRPYLTKDPELVEFESLLAELSKKIGFANTESNRAWSNLHFYTGLNLK